MVELVKEKSMNCISRCCKELNKGGIIIVPTIRWYMIATRADNENGVSAIFIAKDRERSRQPLFVVPEKELIPKYFQVDEYSGKIIERLMPGEITLRMNWVNKELAALYSVNKDNALVYAPSGIFGDITKEIGFPLAATTPNISSDCNSCPALSCGDAEKFVKETGVDVGIIIDGGLSVASIPTTIVDCRNNGEIHLVEREGYVNDRLINRIQRSMV